MSFISLSLIFFFPFIFISWRLITLQYCSGFCHTLTWISHGFTHIPHPNPPPSSLPIPSLWVFPVHQPWVVVSCIQPGLVICFTLDLFNFIILIVMATTFSMILNTSDGSGHPCSDFYGVFQLFTVECYIGRGFVINRFYCIEICSLYLQFPKFF